MVATARAVTCLPIVLWRSTPRPASGNGITRRSTTTSGIAIIRSPPNLTTIRHNGKKTDVVVQSTKDGLVYVLDRDSGESIFPVEERKVPVSGLPGEHPYPTQKFPLKPAPLSRQVYTEADITDISPEAHAYVKARYEKIKTSHKFTRPIRPVPLFGYSGGAEWGGNAMIPKACFIRM